MKKLPNKQKMGKEAWWVFLAIASIVPAIAFKLLNGSGTTSFQLSVVALLTWIVFNQLLLEEEKENLQ